MAVVNRQNVCFGPFELDARAGELYKHGFKLKLQGHPIQILAMLLERPGELITREEIQQKLWPSESETFVDFDHGLNTAVRKLRQALGDEAETPQYIETLPRRGYRFVGEVAAETGVSGTRHQSARDRDGRVAGIGPARTEVRAGNLIIDGYDAGLKASSTQASSTGEATFATTQQAFRVDYEVRRRRLSYPQVLALVLLPLLLSVAAWMLRSAWRRPEPLRVINTKQLTFNGQVGYSSPILENYRSIQTDGRRIYYTVRADNSLRCISVKGGEETPLASPLSDVEPAILHVAPDGSSLLVRQLLSSKGANEAALWVVATNGGAARRLGDIEAHDAAFAPDSKTIVFAKDRDLYLTDLQGLSPAKLVETPGRAFWLRWSPDGQRLRFTVSDPKKLRFSLWELGSDRKLRQLLKDWKAGAQPCCGIWSADGKYFLFSSNGQYWYVPEPISSTRAKPELLTTSGLSITAAAANPLEKEIFVSAASPNFNVFKWDLKTDRTSILYPSLHPIRIHYSPDGQQIAYTKFADRGVELWLTGVDGSNKRQIAASPARVFMARYSPNGQKIAFMTQQPGGPWKVFWASVEGGVWHEIPSPPANQADPNWSPDGESILFGQPPEILADAGGERHLFSYDLRTGKTTEIAGSTGLFSPRWSPDGQHVAAMSIDFHSMSLLDVATGEWKSLVVHGVDHPFWSPNSNWVYFNGLDANLWRVRISDGRLEKVLPTPMTPSYSDCFSNGFAPDGSVLLTCGDPRRNIFALELK